VWLLMVGIGGALGSWARFHLSTRVYARTGDAFPWGTLVVNLSGSFLLGLVIPFLPDPSDLGAVAAMVTVGALGAFTTFSTFALEAVVLLDRGRPARAVGYVVTSLVLGLGAIAGGYTMGIFIAHA
jgi:fluoride exporter